MHSSRSWVLPAAVLSLLSNQLLNPFLHFLTCECAKPWGLWFCSTCGHRPAGLEDVHRADWDSPGPSDSQPPVLLSLERCGYTQTLVIHSCTPFSLLTGSLLSSPQRCENTENQVLLLEPLEVLWSLWYSWSSLGHPTAKSACDFEFGCYSPSFPFEGGHLH